MLDYLSEKGNCNVNLDWIRALSRLKYIYMINQWELVIYINMRLSESWRTNPIQGLNPETLRTITSLYRIEGFKEGPQFVPHYAERRQPLRQPI